MIFNIRLSWIIISPNLVKFHDEFNMSPLNATLLYLLLWITKLQYDVQMYIMINDEKVLVVEKGTLLFSNLLQLYKQRNRQTNDQG